ncbi:MAG: relaxase domain-containing protein [Planctomycetaceae bacterium]|nr:relaxase domain-containing protein [Planctomycetaceae bacterium]
MALTLTQSRSIDGAARYFDESLTQGDYYVNGLEVAGMWNGKAAELLGLKVGTKVTAPQFKRLLSGMHPITGKKLAQRLRKDRRPGFDVCLSVPKSVSLAWAINGDKEIQRVLREAVQETMKKDVEPLMCRRVRTGKHVHTQQRKRTGNIVHAGFLHTTSRPVAGQAADPHLHIHCFTFNQTSENGVHYAAEPEEIFRQRATLQAKFEARLARKLESELGYIVEERTFTQSGRLKRGWELKSIQRSTIEKFSSRTQQIEEFAKEHGITDAARKGRLGATVRSRKDKGTTLSELRQSWRSRLTPEELKTFANLKSSKAAGESSESMRVQAAVAYALDHHLFRQSTVERHVIVGTALEQGVTVSPEAIETALDQASIIQRSLDVRGDQRDFVTTPEVLAAEREMITFARDGRGTRKALSREEHVFQRDWLNAGQKAAVNHLLKGRDTVMCVTGGAGVGKTSMLSEAVEAIEAGGKRVFTFAPSTGACEVLHEKGFQKTQTVEHLLRNTNLHPELKDGVLLIDEAGLLDVRSMNGIFQIAKAQNCRVILSGDARQHASPRRGEAYRMLQQEAGLNIAKIEEVQRQQGRYKQAVELVSRGHEVIDAKTGLTGLLAGFDLLDRMGKIKEISGDDRHAELAAQYVQARQSQQSTLVVSPTHAEKDALTETIRNALRGAGAIGKEDVEFLRLKSLNLSDAEKRDLRTYRTSGTIIQFHQNVKGGYQRGDRYRVCQEQEGQPVLRPIGGGGAKPIPLDAADRFEVYREQTISLAVGDHIRFTLGGKSLQSQRISNGRLDEIESFDADGNLILKSGMTISRAYGHLDLGYVVSSHASQGKDRTLAMAAMGSESLAAINSRQFYVTCSRASRDILLFVDDKAAVRKAIAQAGEQMSATELMKQAEERAVSQHRQHHHRQFLERVRDWWQKHGPRHDLPAAQRRHLGGAGMSPTLNWS